MRKIKEKQKLKKKANTIGYVPSIIGLTQSTLFSFFFFFFNLASISLQKTLIWCCNGRLDRLYKLVLVIIYLFDHILQSVTYEHYVMSFSLIHSLLPPDRNLRLRHTLLDLHMPQRKDGFL